MTGRWSASTVIQPERLERPLRFPLLPFELLRRRFMFGDYVRDQEHRELTLLAEVEAVGPQVFDLLLHLVRKRDRKDDLLQAV